MAIEIRKVVKEDYKQFYDDAVEKMAKVEEFAKAKVEELVKDDKERLQKIIDVCTEEIEVEVPDEVQDETAEGETTEEFMGE